MREGVRPARSGCPGSPPRHGPAQRRLGLPGWLAPWHLRRAPPRPRGRCQPPVEGLYALGSRGGGGRHRASQPAAGPVLIPKGAQLAGRQAGTLWSSTFAQPAGTKRGISLPHIYDEGRGRLAIHWQGRKKAGGNFWRRSTFLLPGG